MSDGLRARGAMRTAVVWDVLHAAVESRALTAGRSSLDILDSGGGTGAAAVPLARLGHRVTVVDPSPNALATLRQRAAEAGVSDLISPLQGDAGGVLDVVGGHSADAVLCHGVLEVVDEPRAALDGYAKVLRPGGFLSVLCANRNAAVLARAVAGHLDDARRVLAGPDGRWGGGDPVRRRYTLDSLVTLLGGAGFAVRSVHGVRTFADLVPETVVDGDAASREALLDLEAAVSALPDFQALAAQLHIVAHLH